MKSLWDIDEEKKKRELEQEVKKKPPTKWEKQRGLTLSREERLKALDALHATQ